MKAMTEMAAEASMIAGKRDLLDLILEMESKLALIEHTISQEPRQLEDLGFTGISYLISDIRKGLTQTESFCQKAGDYFYFLDNPELLVEVNQVEMKSAKDYSS